MCAFKYERLACKVMRVASQGLAEIGISFSDIIKPIFLIYVI